MAEEFDIVILGSGFGGTLLATILSRQGYQVAVIDRGRHPRFAIGESSTPAADLILKDLCDKYQLRNLAPLTRYGSWKDSYPQLNCGRKRGFSYFHQSPGESFITDNENRNQLLIAASSDDLRCDMHWYRADVDQMLANDARSRGVHLLEGAEITNISHHHSGWTFSYHTRDEANQSQANQSQANQSQANQSQANQSRANQSRANQSRANQSRANQSRADRSAAGQLSGKIAIDASGSSQLLLNHLEIADLTHELKSNSRSVYTHLTSVDSWSKTLGEARSSQHPFNSDAAAQHHLLDEGWMWLLRFDDGVTSVGVCFDESPALDDPFGQPLRRPASATDEFWQVVQRYPDLAQLFKDAQLADRPNRWCHTGRLQRLCAEAAGEDWVALPHCVGFIDPMHSTGIALTMFAIERIAAALDPQRDPTQRLAGLSAYSRSLIDTFKWIDQLVWACYRTRKSAELFHAAVMLYFTATVHFETARQDRKPTEFLSADWPVIRSIANWFVRELGKSDQRLAGAPSHDDELAKELVIKLAPLSNVGLGDPAAKKMYWHTNCGPD